MEIKQRENKIKYIIFFLLKKKMKSEKENVMRLTKKFLFSHKNQILL